jgi:hypothetical protein
MDPVISGTRLGIPTRPVTITTMSRSIDALSVRGRDTGSFISSTPVTNINAPQRRS